MTSLQKEETRRIIEENRRGGGKGKRSWTFVKI
jgi:hypothetical protein